MVKATTSRRAPKPPPPPKPQTQQSAIHSTTKYPFTKPPSSLLHFLETLPPSDIYLLHTDSFPTDHKRRIFLVPFFLNIFLTILIFYRAYTAIPTYFAILLATLGHRSNASVDIASTTWSTLLDIGGHRAAMFFFDFALYQFVATWPLDFFRWTRPPGPAMWRWKIGYKAREVVVRKSRRWATELTFPVPNNNNDEEAVRLGEGKMGEKVYGERVLPGIDAVWVGGRTGMSMLDRNWDLWYQGMVDAHRLMEKGQIKIEDFSSRMVIVHDPKRGGWLVWKCDDYDDKDGDVNASAEKIQRIKAKLDSMGKEGLFWRWTELVQFETETKNDSTARGGLEERLRRKGREMFAAQGVDFDEFWKGVGGLEDMPGLKSSSSALA